MYRSRGVTNRTNQKLILYNWKTADQIEAGFSLNNRPK